MTKQPNSRHCFVCGLENIYGLRLKFYQTGPGEVTTHCSVPEQYQGYPGVVHGGVVAAMLDEVAGRAVMGADPEQTRFMVTARLTIKYRKNVPVAQPLTIVGVVEREKKRMAAATASIYDAEQQILAEASALLVDLPEETFEAGDLASLGWQVYPDEAPARLPEAPEWPGNPRTDHLDDKTDLK
jgi:uncharacterized protein (TIGR00369 family)